MKKVLIIMGALFTFCAFTYTDLENSVNPQIKKDLQNTLNQTVKDKNNLDQDLFNAVREGDVTAVIELIKKGANVDARDGHRHTPLMYASFFGNAKICSVLLALKADVNARDIQNDTALILAKNPKVVEVLINYNADINAQDNFGRTALMYALENDNLNVAFALTLYRPNLAILDKRGDSAVMYLSANKNYSIENYKQDKNEDPLKAYKIGEIFDRVMRRQDCTLRNELGQTALDIAKLNKNSLIIKKIEYICK